MKKLKPQKYAKAKKLVGHRTDKKKNLIYYRMLKLHIRHGMIVDKIQ